MGTTNPETQRARYYRKVAAGICVRCTKPADYLGIMCEEHRLWMNLKRRKEFNRNGSKNQEATRS